MIFAPSEDSDQPGHPPGLIRVFDCELYGKGKDPSFLHADSENSDQTGRMLRMIWVFAGRTCHFFFFLSFLNAMYICSNKAGFFFEAVYFFLSYFLSFFSLK